MGFFDNFRQKVISTASPQEKEDPKLISQSKDTVDNLISLGVLLWEVAQADDKFLPEEETKIGDFLASNGVSQKEIKKYNEKVSKGRIKIKEYDFRNLTSKRIAAMPRAEYKKLMEDMIEYTESGKNFNINLTDFGKQKE